MSEKLKKIDWFFYVLVLFVAKEMFKLHLKEPGFTYSACGQFTKHREVIQKLSETGNSNYLWRNELEKACFNRDAPYFDSKELAQKTVSEKILKDRAYETARNHMMDIKEH